MFKIFKKDTVKVAENNLNALEKIAKIQAKKYNEAGQKLDDITAKLFNNVAELNRIASENKA